MDDTRHTGYCDPHDQRFPPGDDCPICSKLAEAPTGLHAAAIIYGLRRRLAEAYAARDQTLLDAARHELGYARTGLCRCGHDGYDGHDMRSVPPECLTAGCQCGIALTADECERLGLDPTGRDGSPRHPYHRGNLTPLELARLDG